ncbi:LysR family transcriptional regulator [Aquitalea sp. USM4]|uniref:LysR family transcriptional regulator n=1 Tax=Aquitalea sp. USM4 TaxID=1590041 RepID=UPI00103EC709|nr:LysR family transcriptional regulator [Aquitalea sp. USM4]QBJ80441.1 LysR family transcriptional regulator [Aquitalea sp. USM4]
MISEEITLRKLQTLAAFVATGSLPRTAERMQMSTVSVHRALHSLEDAMRCALFRHEGRRLIALPAALALAEAAEDAERTLENGIRKAREKAGFGAAQLKIGAMYSLTVELIPRLVMGVKLRRPELAIELQLGSNAQLLDKLHTQTVDALLMSLPDEGSLPGLLAVPLFEDQLYLASSLTSPAPASPTADLADYRHEKFVALSDGFATSRDFQRLFSSAGYQPDVVMRVDDIFSLMNLVAAGVGLSLLPGRVSSLFAGRIRFTPLAQEWRSTQRIGLLLQECRERDPNLLALLAEARMLGQQMSAHGLASQPLASG